MIQRIQTIFLLLAAGLLGALWAFPFSTVSASADLAEAGIFTDQIFNIQDHIALLVLFMLAAGLALIGIFLFKKRPAQMKLVLLSNLVNLGGIGFAFFLLGQVGAFEQSGMDIKAGLVFPFLATVFLGLAHRFIKKDEKIVKESYSRLR
ncbi:MAG: hypothetical protein Sapg2KO_05830 [Saprospiraceae bacterium]